MRITPLPMGMPCVPVASASSFFDPTSVVSDVAFWFTASDASTISETSGKVSQIDDKSGNGNHLKQTNSARQPTYEASNAVANSKPALVWPSAGNNAIGMAMDAAVSCDFLLFLIAYGDGTQSGSFGNFRDIHSSDSMAFRTYGSSGTEGLVSSFSALPSGVKVNGAAPGSNDYLPMPYCVLTFETSSAAGTNTFRYLMNRVLNDRGWYGPWGALVGTTSVPSAADQTALIDGFKTEGGIS